MVCTYKVDLTKNKFDLLCFRHIYVIFCVDFIQYKVPVCVLEKLCNNPTYFLEVSQ